MSPGSARPSTSFGAVLRAEGLVTQRIYASLESDTHADHQPVFPRTNVFGEEILVDKSADFAALVAFAKEDAESGVRVTLIGTAPEVLAARRPLRALVASRLGVCVHVLADPHAMRGAVYGLLDLGFGLLFSSGPEDSFDLALIARRAAEDCGVPFFIVHEHGSLTSFEVVSMRDADALGAYVGTPRTRLFKVSDPSHPVFVHADERAFARRAGFALSSAMRGFESVAHRRHDVMERAGPGAMGGGGDADAVLVGLGVTGDCLLGVAERSQNGPRPLAALKITALRPLDGPRIVKTLARAHAVTVIEAGLDPLTDTMPLARELKAAFTDAITWAPGYPGVGRVPRFTSAVLGQGGLTEDDLAAAVCNMREGDGARRSFVFGEQDAPRKTTDADRDVSAAPRIRISCNEPASAAEVARGILAALAGAAGLRARATLRAGEEGAVFVDVSASKDTARAEPVRGSFDWAMPAPDDEARASGAHGEAGSAALAAAFIIHAHRALVDGGGIASEIAAASGNPEDAARARAAVDSGRWRTR